MSAKVVNAICFSACAAGTHIRVVDAVLILVSSQDDEAVRRRILRADDADCIARVAGQQRVPTGRARVRCNDKRAPRVEAVRLIIHDDFAAVVRPRLKRWRAALHGIRRAARAQHAVRNPRGGEYTSRWRIVNRVALRIRDAEVLAFREIEGLVLQKCKRIRQIRARLGLIRRGDDAQRVQEQSAPS